MSGPIPPARWRPAPGVVAREIAGEHLLVPVRHGAAQMDFIYMLNDTGSLIYRLLAEGHDAAAIAGAIGAAYAIPLERARADVDLFLDALLDAGLARREEAP